MSFSVTKEKWLETESNRLAGFVLMPRFWHKTWTDKTLHEELLKIGLKYTLDEVTTLNDALHKQGIVEDVPVVVPAPEPASISA